MADPAGDGEKLIASLSEEPGMAGLVGPGSRVLVWSLDGARLLWASDNVSPWVREHASYEVGSLSGGASITRLRELGGGLAPRTGFRLERLRLGTTRLDRPATYVCRIVPFGDGEALMTTALDGPAAEPSARAAPGAAGQEAVGPEAPASPGERHEPSFAWQTEPEHSLAAISTDLAPHEARQVPAIRSEEPRPASSPSVPVRSVARRAFDIGNAMQAGATALTGQAGETVFGVLQAWFAPHTIEQKRSPPVTPPDGRTLTVNEAPDETGQPAGQGALSLSERGALHEIARALGREGAAREDTAGPAAEIVALPPQRSRESEPGEILDRLPIGILVLRDETPLFLNRSVLDITGHDDVPGLVARGGPRTLFGRGFEGFKAGRTWAVEVKAATGEMLPFEMRVEPIAWGDLPATLVSLVAAADLEPGRRVEALERDLARRDRRVGELAGTVELAADGVVTIDPSGRILWLSRSAEHLFGFGANEATGQAVTALVVPEDHRATLGCIEAVGRREPGAVEECEIRGRPRGSPVLPLSMRVGRIDDALGSGFSIAFRDLTRFNAMQGELRDARAAAERASATRAEFLARISHEIRTPLTAITGFAELMLEERFGPIGSERYKSYIHDIHDSGGHVISLVNDLLDLAKVTAGQTDLRPASLDINLLAQQCVALAAPIAARERTIVRTSFATGLPRTYADERSVRQIVLNILSNAIRFTGAGGQVIVSTTRGGPGDVILRVRDTGPGMSREEIEAALTPFRQVPATRRGDGTGLGLPLSKALVEANRGAFAITSAPEAGTLIEIRLPAALPVPDAIAAE